MAKTQTTTVNYENITSTEYGTGIEYSFRGLSIQVYRAGLVFEGCTDVFREMSQISLLRFMLEIAKQQHVQFVASKRFYPKDKEWPLSI